MAFDASYRSPQETSNYVSYQDAEAKDQTLRDAVLRSREQAETHATGMQMNRQKIAENDITLQERQQDLRDQQIGRQAYMQSGGDLDSYQRLLMQAGVSPKMMTAVQQQILNQRKTYADMEKTQLENHEKKVESVGSAAQALLNLPDEATRAIHWADTRADAIANGHAGEAEIPKDYPGAEWLTLHRNAAVTAQQSIANAAKDRELAATEKNANTSEKNANTAAEKQANEAPGQIAQSGLLQNKLKQITEADPKEFATLIDSVAPPAVKENAALNQRMKAQVAFALQRGDVEGAKAAIAKGAEEIGALEKATDPRVQANKVAVTVATTDARNNANQAASGMTDDDYARAGEQYKRTGVMPPMGRDTVTRGKIEHAGNEWARKEGLTPADVVTMQAAYAGDKESLKKFQGQRDQVVSFEKTALKNIDLFEQAASKIPDTGVPWINTPLRLLDQKLVGDENMAAVNAARAVATNEIAKVTSGGSMSGVLSDSARQEVKDYNPKNATFAQTRAVIGILKKDMANRHESMDATLGDIKSRIGGGGESKTALPKGDGQDATKAVIQQYLDANGNDKDKTRKALADNGWKIPAVKK